MNIRKLLGNMHRSAALILSLLMLLSMFGCSGLSDTLEFADDVLEIIDQLDTTASQTTYEQTTEPDTVAPLSEDGSYYTKNEVAAYIHYYKKLPSNFITKAEAGELGWEGGSVEKYLNGAAIGGDVFGNREGLLPKANGRIYYECDIETNGKNSRGAKRIVYSNDGLIYYTDDHYESFTLLYGEDN